MQDTVQGVTGWIVTFAGAFAGAGAGVFGWRLVFAGLARWARAANALADELFLPQAGGPGRLMAALAGASLCAAFLPYAAAPREVLDHVLTLCWIGAVSWLAVNMSAFLEKVLARRYSLGDENNLLARKIRTRYAVFHRSIIVAVAILALGAGLMTFDAARRLGASILASAGLLGAVAGFSAQKTLGAFFAGIQIALTQPIRVDDVVVAEGKWGRVEEIAFTYVTLRLWDEKRLILPVSYFLEKPFENWTRTNAQILGSATIRADYSVDIEAVRERLAAVCREESGRLWDGRVCTLQATGAGERVIELRALVSSSDASKNWDLRCLARERLIRHLREEQPHALPKIRARLERCGEGASAPAEPVRQDPGERASRGVHEEEGSPSRG